MRYIEGQVYYTVGEVAAAAGVSLQTVRHWGNEGRVHSHRSPGGHRLFDEDAKQAVVDYAASQRRNGPRAHGLLPPIRSVVVRDEGQLSTGAAIRAARESAGLSQADVASAAMVSRSLLSAIERGSSGASVTVFNRIAEALHLPPSALAPQGDKSGLVMKRASRPRTVLSGGVTWEELASPGHTLAPAVLIVPPQGGSGGKVTFTRENFVTILDGSLDFELSSSPMTVRLDVGDSLVITPGVVHSWLNRSSSPATAIWVEQLLSPGMSV